MYPMVYHEVGNGSAPPDQTLTDFDTIDEAQDFIETLLNSNSHLPSWELARNIRLCIVIDEYDGQWS